MDKISGAGSSMGSVSKVSTVEGKVDDYPSPTDFPEKEEDYNWRTSKISISGSETEMSLLFKMGLYIYIYIYIYLFIYLFTEYYLKCHSKRMKENYNSTVETIIENQVYAVEAVKLEYLLKQTPPSTKVC